MFVIFILLWLIAVLLVYANPKISWARWAAYCLFLNGFGGVAVIFKDNIIPFAKSYNNSNLDFLCLMGKGIADVLHHYFATYALLGFVLFFTNFLDYKIKNSCKRIVMLILLIPSVAMCILYPLTPEFKPDYKVLSAWVVLYTLAAIVILIVSVVKEKNSTKMHQKIFACIFTIPSTLGITWTSYLSIALGYHEIWYLNIWIIVLQFAMFVFMAAKYGFLGVKLKVERINLDETIDTMLNGMSMISHAIKNEASTISLCVDAIRAIDGVNAGADKKLMVVKESCRNLVDFTQKINKFGAMEVDLKPCDISDLVEKAVNQVMPLVAGKNISIVNKCREKITARVDGVHVAEVLKNLLINAIDAIEGEGIITVETGLINEKFCISVTDNGMGISQNALDKVLTPFYSTKKGKNNFGLGLSYCYKVMKSHNGNLRVSSKVNHGTTMSLLFPVGILL